MTIEKQADEFSATVSTEGRVLETLYIGSQPFNSVTAIVRAAFLAGARARMTVQAIFEANLLRVERWHSLKSWSPLEWAGAMCGEAGEAANAAKKLKRVTDGIQNKDNRLEAPAADELALYKKQVLKEYADTLIYGVLLCASVDATAEEVEQTIREVFNQKSEEYGFPERL